MKKTFFVFLSCCLILLIHPVTSAQVAKQGISDLSSYSFENDGIVKLRGEWEFYRDKFYTPEYFSEFNPKPDIFINQPVNWSDLNDGKVNTSVQGYATYRLRVILPKGFKSIESQTLLGIKVIECHSAYEIFIDGKNHGGNGKISNSPEGFVPVVIPETYPFIPTKDTIEIIIQAANFFDNNQGGLDDHVMLGTYSQILDQSRGQSALFLISFGILFFMAFYHLILYLLRRKERLNLYFALICLVMALFSLWQGDKLILQYLPGMSMEVYFRIWMAAIGGIGIWFLFYYELLPIEINRSVKRIVSVFFLFHAIFALLLPVAFYFKIINLIFISALIALVWLLIAFIRAVFNRRKYAVIILIGMLIPIATAVNDTLFGLDLIVTGYYAPAGFLFFLFSQSYLISLKFSRSFHQVEVLSGELEKMNVSLENMVNERTLQLTDANEELRQLNLTKDKFISIITHDLRNPFGIIINISEMLLRREYVKSDYETERFLKLLKDAAIKSHKLLENLVEWSKVQSGKILFQPQITDIHLITEDAIQLLKLNLTAKNVKIINKIPPSFTVNADPNMIQLIIRNLLTNAVKYSFEGGIIEIDAVRKGDETEVSVKDNGTGISSEQINQLFRIDLRRSEKGTDNEEGTGLGLILCHEFIRLHDGKIWVESEPGKGSRFTFRI